MRKATILTVLANTMVARPAVMDMVSDDAYDSSTNYFLLRISSEQVGGVGGGNHPSVTGQEP